MNRLRGRKKGKDEALPRPSIESESSSPFKMFGRSKKQVEESTPQVDLSSALPPTDDFRTSLLMTGLSARFSMLREQDDPSSKLGKASDDSVLQPKRQSRMDFGLSSGLHDIAEDNSFRSPPFARMDSSYQSDDAASISGSIMNRSKPTEGNNLFGGRQKIYKISATGGNGRTLYDDDVAQSAFQRWRQTERERTSSENERTGDAQEFDSLGLGPGSSQDFSRRRETSSTMSSIPSAARISTAATSVASQAPPSVKDGQASSTTPTGLPERSVTRTRRLYEQSLAEGMQDHQSSALSRIDTLSKGRFSPRTPDLASNASSPSGFAAFDRNSDRRPMISKASAPNLRSFSPPNTASAHPSPAESTSRFPTIEAKTTTTSPPLSPPMSETEEHPTLSIGANDRGKATALGLFTRPAGQYDENRYAQRQRQLQQGRETPTSRHRTESNGSQPTNRSRSSSSMNRTHAERSDSATKSEPTVREEIASPTFLNVGDDDDDMPAPTRPTPGYQSTPQVKLERPADQDHPAFRHSALPTPLALSRKSSAEALNKPDVSPEDSPTLGPGPAGLSGMVRQHLRNVSTASSVYDNRPQDDDDTALAQARDSRNAHHAIDLAVDSNPWGSDSKQWAQAEEPSETQKPEYSAAHEITDEQLTRGRDSTAVGTNGRETDEFARNLADGAKRVRERLTTYVESDHSRSTSPAAPPVDNSDLPPPRPGAFSVLRSRSSRGSVREQTGERGRSRSAARKVLGLGSSNNPHAPMPTRPSVDDGAGQEEPSGSSGEKSPTDKDEGAHAGLKAFRQARRELQRMKELETKQRRQAAPTHAPPPPPSAMRSSLPSQDRGPPPVTYNRTPSGESGSRPGSVGPSERDRSGSEASNNGVPTYRPRIRTASSAYDEPRASSDMRRPQAQTMSPYSNFDNTHMPMTSSTPNLALSSSTGAPPPLPPINPRRKGMGSPLPHEENIIYQSGGKPPMSPVSQGRSASRTRMISDEEMGAGQFRQRLRKVPSDANGVAPRSHGNRSSPSYEGAPRMPAQSHTSSGNGPGGMF